MSPPQGSPPESEWNSGNITGAQRSTQQTLNTRFTGTEQAPAEPATQETLNKFWASGQDTLCAHLPVVLCASVSLPVRQGGG